MLFNNKSLALKFTLITLLVSGLCIISLSWYAFYDADEILKKQSINRLTGETERLITLFKNKIDQMRFDTDQFAKSEEIKGYYRAYLQGGYDFEQNMTDDLWIERLTRGFVSLLQQRPEYLQIRYISAEADKREMVRVERKNNQIMVVPKKQLQNKAGREYVEKTLLNVMGEQYISDVNLNKERGNISFPIQPVIRVASPVYYQGGKPKGLIVINVNFDKLAYFFEKTAENVSYLISNNKGDYLFNQDKDKRFKLALGGSPGFIKDFPSLNLLENDDDAIHVYDLPDQSKSLLVHKLQYSSDDNNVMYISALVSHTLIKEESIGFGNRLIIGVLLTLLVLSFVMNYFVRRMLNPIILLTEAADKITQGESIDKLPALTQKDEIGTLAKSFDVMIKHLDLSREQLKKLAASLENQVKERTLELEGALKKANESTRVKSEFFATMSHEIRTPMNGILGMGELLFNTDLNNQQAHYVQTIYQSGESLLRIINDILDISKMDADSLSLHNENFNLRDLLQEVISPFLPKFKKKKLDIIIRYNPVDMPVCFYSDKLRLKQIFINLINNALKFTNKGTVIIEVALINEKDNIAHLNFKIIDTGIGIAEKDQTKLFEPFTQADGSTTRKYGGTGLGLTIVQRLVNIFKGSISLTSKEGEGTTFIIDLNLKIADSKTKYIKLDTSAENSLSDKPTLLDKNNMGRLNKLPSSLPHLIEKQELIAPDITLLIIEDNDINADVLLSMLKNMGYHALRESSGENALKAIQQHKIDLIFMDCQMPGMDGFETTKIIRKHELNKSSKVPIIALTANALVGDKEKCLAAGMDDYLSKPVRATDLKQAIHQWLKNIDRRNNLNENIVDYTVLDNLQNDIGDITKLLQHYLQDLPNQKQTLQKAIEDKNLNLIQSLCHNIKANSATYGAIALSNLAKDLEEQIKLNKSPNITFEWQNISKIFDLSTEKLLAYGKANE